MGFMRWGGFGREYVGGRDGGKYMYICISALLNPSYFAKSLLDPPPLCLSSSLPLLPSALYSLPSLLLYPPALTPSPSRQRPTSDIPPNPILTPFPPRKRPLSHQSAPLPSSHGHNPQTTTSTYHPPRASRSTTVADVAGDNRVPRDPLTRCTRAARANWPGTGCPLERGSCADCGPR